MTVPTTVESGAIAGSHELVWVRGPDAVTFLDGLISQDVASMPDGTVRPSLLLAPQGKLRATMWVLRHPSGAALVTDVGRGAVVAGDLTRFKLRVDVEISALVAGVDVVGADSGDVLTAAGLPVPEAGTWTEVEGGVVASIDHRGWPTRRWFVTVPLPAAIADLPAERAEALRIAAGEPRMGRDIDERTIPQEAGVVAEAVDFSKGCYLGQELVARIDSRGRVNRHLRILEIETPARPPLGAVASLGGKVLGELTSIAAAEAGVLGLALLRREAEPGAMVDLAWEGGSARATVRAVSAG